MRYIGSKQALLTILSEEIVSRSPASGTFCDLFAGSVAVSRHFKGLGYNIISNDIMRFSYFLQVATVELNSIPRFDNLNVNPIDFLNSMDIENFDFVKPKFATRHYAPNENSLTNYFTLDNANRIDAVRQQIEVWLSNKEIDKFEHAYLIAALIEALPFVSNTTGTYGAYLKKWDKRAFKSLTLLDHEITDNVMDNSCYCKDANHLVKEIEGQILYIDPPYNGRQYGSNYHVLETIARYDNPDVKGITSMRDNSDVRSKYCMKSQAENALNDLIANASFENIFLSYSTDGILSALKIREIFERHCISGSVELVKIPYRRYKRIKTEKSEQLFELLFVGKK